MTTPSKQESKRRYQGTQGQEYHRAKRSIPDDAFPWIARLRAAKFAPYIRPSDIVLEYGVGLGWNLAALTCARKLGYDLGEFLAPTVRQHGIEFVDETDTLADGSVDAIICHHTLEHTWQPPNVLGECLRLLRPGSRLLLFVPYEKEQRYRRFNPNEPNHHLYSWNVQTLGNLVQDAGYVIDHGGLRPFGQERFAAGWASRLRLGERGFRLLRWLANSLKHEFEVSVIAHKP